MAAWPKAIALFCFFGLGLGACNKSPAPEPAPADNLERWAQEVCACERSECIESVTEKYAQDLMYGGEHKVQAAQQKAFDCAMEKLGKKMMQQSEGK
tara:strand:- start:322 stop:612 length:291 start_codon:yes stop_codon:yes gene_type:complete